MKNFTAGHRYFVFGYDTYYPGGGLNDLLGTATTLDEAKALAESSGDQWVDVLDSQTGRLLEGCHERGCDFMWLLESK